MWTQIYTLFYLTILSDFLRWINSLMIQKSIVKSVFDRVRKSDFIEVWSSRTTGFVTRLELQCCSNDWNYLHWRWTFWVFQYFLLPLFPRFRIFAGAGFVYSVYFTKKFRAKSKSKIFFLHWKQSHICIFYIDFCFVKK